IINRINAQLEHEIAGLPKTLLYEYDSVESLSTHLMQEEGHKLLQLFACNGPYAVTMEDDEFGKDERAHKNEIYEEKVMAKSGSKIIAEDERIAIIGMHAYFPKAKNLDEYWEYLKKGKDVIETVPKNRWDYEEFYDPDPQKAAEGKIYCKWGAFLEDHDKFDNRFFNIPSNEAMIIDPQERLFLQSVWSAFEDAGYTRDCLKEKCPEGKSAGVGVFAGVTTNSYNLLAPDEWRKGNMVTPGAMPWSIANRISYFFDFKGPSVPVDTACSSSLVAIHQACESLRNGECGMAVAGGVNLYLHPAKYHSFCQRRMVALKGKCRSYGDGDDGFVPGEAVGAIILRPLKSALEDNDRIYAVIAGSAYEHCGRSNGYSAPNPKSQADVIVRTLERANINPETIGYIEGHGTGTQLGDSLEIAAISSAFRGFTAKKNICPIGSVKANVGHAESAASIAGIVKVLMQFKHRRYAPSIHVENENPNVDFQQSPCFLLHESKQWQTEPGSIRRALINSFGAGGVNASMLIEEHNQESHQQESTNKGPCLIVISAINKERLREYVENLLDFSGKMKTLDLKALAYTLQVGREAFAERLAFVVSDKLEMIQRCRDWRDNQNIDAFYQGVCKRNGSSKNAKNDEDENHHTDMNDEKDLISLAQKWCKGESVDWKSLYKNQNQKIISLPTYPFEKKRHWVSDPSASSGRLKQTHGKEDVHPLITYNSSNLKRISFCSILSDQMFYAQEHRINNERLFPGSGFLEIACVAGILAGERRVRKISDIVWSRPLSFAQGSQSVHTYLNSGDGDIGYVIATYNDDNEKVVHCEGKLLLSNGNFNTDGNENIGSVKEWLKKCTSLKDGKGYYDVFNSYGFHYGEAFQTIQKFGVNDSFALAELRLNDRLERDFEQFILHPSILDGALQAVAGLIDSVEAKTPHIPFAVDEVEICRPLNQACFAYVEFAKNESSSSKNIKKFNIMIINESGDVLVTMRNFYVRAVGQGESATKCNEAIRSDEYALK
ncbi:MAG: malonyl CoA-ACP transacylase, partial [Chitinivibrionales bacterium]|nr:malonyl CoA-ACP transacylase [Chitinivibrionales bacterium]